MSRIGAIVRRLYAEELKSAADGTARTRTADKNDKKIGRWGRIRRALAGSGKALSRRRVVTWAIRIAVVLFVLVVVIETVFQFNRLTSWYTIVLARGADVDRELRRRENLIPALVVEVSQYASYEQGVFKYVSDARDALKMIRAPGAPKSPASSMLEKILPGLIALAEQYPDLKTSHAIQDLIKETSNTENRIAEAKGEYNKAAEVYNQYRTTFPGNFFALVFRFSSVPYMGMEEGVEVPAIDLRMIGRAGQTPLTTLAE